MAEAKTAVIYPPIYGPDSDPPAIFDGTTRLYLSYVCPYARRAWITVNYKGLHGQVQFVPFDLKNRPAWYKEKVYPLNKVPSLEHDNKIIGESLEVVKYIDTQFEGPKLIPQDPARKEFAEEMAAYSDTFVKNMWTTFRSEGDAATEMGSTLDHLENCLYKFEDGPFFVGHFSFADIAFVTFIEEAHDVLMKKKNYDITTGRPKLGTWIEEMHKIDSYTVTKVPPHV
ncbi:glutathione S-transferase L3-like [Aristolochia californica]|uniref:glutathione S-transferase L3-like n=1 Tax=Aristolochia californica TaxID=171875 RepID=UPI0035E28B83